MKTIKYREHQYMINPIPIPKMDGYLEDYKAMLHGAQEAIKKTKKIMRLARQQIRVVENVDHFNTWEGDLLIDCAQDLTLGYNQIDVIYCLYHQARVEYIRLWNAIVDLKEIIAELEEQNQEWGVSYYGRC